MGAHVQAIGVAGGGILGGGRVHRQHPVEHLVDGHVRALLLVDREQPLGDRPQRLAGHAQQRVADADAGAAAAAVLLDPDQVVAEAEVAGQVERGRHHRPQRRHRSGAGLVGQPARVGHDVGDHPPHLAVGRHAQHDVQHRRERRVVERAAVDQPTAAVERGNGCHVRPRFGGRADQVEAGLEGHRERRRRARGQAQPVTGVGVGEVVVARPAGIVGEQEVGAVLGVIQAVAERVEMFDALTDQVGAGDHQPHHRRQLPLLLDGGGRPSRRRSTEAVEHGLQAGQEVVVAAQHRGRIGVEAASQQPVERAQLQPDVADAGRRLAGGHRRAQQRPVQAAGAGARDHVDAKRGAKQLQHLRIQAGCGAGAAVAAGAVELVGDAAHPHRQADATVHHQRQPQLQQVVVADVGARGRHPQPRRRRRGCRVRGHRHLVERAGVDPVGADQAPPVDGQAADRRTRRAASRSRSRPSSGPTSCGSGRRPWWRCRRWLVLVIFLASS